MHLTVTRLAALLFCGTTLPSLASETSYVNQFRISPTRRPTTSRSVRRAPSSRLRQWCPDWQPTPTTAAG